MVVEVVVLVVVADVGDDVVVDLVHDAITVEATSKKLKTNQINLFFISHLPLEYLPIYFCFTAIIIDFFKQVTVFYLHECNTLLITLALASQIFYAIPPPLGLTNNH